MSRIRKVAYISLTPSRKAMQLVQYKRLTLTHLNPQNFNLIKLISHLKSFFLRQIPPMQNLN